MEGFILSLEAMTSPWGVIAGLSLLAVVAGVVLFGYMAEEERTGKAIFWAESPFTGIEESSYEEEEFRLAA